MTDLPDCKRVRESLDEAALGARPELELHLGACAACADLVRRQRALVRMLSALPPAPAAEFPAPALPSARVLRARRLVHASWIAAAAAAILVAVALHSASPGQTRVRIDAVVDVADAPPPADDPLLLLTAGVEAVAMRRPTESR